MTRAELRRAQKQEKKSKKTYNMTADQLASMEAKLYDKAYKKAKADVLNQIDVVGEEIFKMMLVFPTNLLINDYWPKTAKKRIPTFVEDVLSLYEAWIAGVVDMDEMVKLTEEYSGIKLIQEGTSTWKTLRRKGQINDEGDEK